MSPILTRFTTAVLLVCMLIQCNEKDSIGLCQLQSDSFNDGTATTTSYVYVERRLTTETTTAPGYSLTLNYKYDAEGLINMAEAVKNGVTGKISYNYGVNKQLVRSISVFGTDTVTTVYQYNPQGQLTKSIQAYVGAVLTDSITVNYSYPDLVTRNPGSKIKIQGGALPDTTVYQYDNGINPFREFFPSIKTFNNITGIENSGTTVTIGYSYNELGYPVSAVWSTGETQTFSFKCE